MTATAKKNSSQTEYFDIRKLFKVLDAKKWTEGKNFMKFWADGSTKTAKIDPVKNKSTIGANVNTGLRIYTIKWDWLNQFSSATTKYKEFLDFRIKNSAVKNLIKRKYGSLKQTNKVFVPFNDWLTDGLAPAKYLSKIKLQQLQFINVAPFEINGGILNDLVAAVNGFNYFSFYKGITIDTSAYRLKKLSQSKKKQRFAPILKDIDDKALKEIELYLKQPKIKSIIYISHVGVYAGDIYEFNGNQYLATWDIDNNKVELSKWDYAFGTSDTDDSSDLAVTNETYNIYRKNTGKGGDFLALTPIRLTEYPIVIPVY